MIHLFKHHCNKSWQVKRDTWRSNLIVCNRTRSRVITSSLGSWSISLLSEIQNRFPWKSQNVVFLLKHLLESAELSIIGQTPDSLDQIPERIESKKANNQKVWHSLALLRGFLSLASQEQNTGSSDLNASLNKFRVLVATYISWKLLETMFHVESERKQMSRRQR